MFTTLMKLTGPMIIVIVVCACLYCMDVWNAHSEKGIPLISARKIVISLWQYSGMCVVGIGISKRKCEKGKKSKNH